MIRDLNQIVRRKHFNNFLEKGGIVNMMYGISDKVSLDAKNMIVNDEINERLVVLKNQLDFLDSERDYKKVYNDNEVRNAKCGLEKIRGFLETLNFKKINLQALLDNSLSKINISEAIKIRQDLNKIEDEIKDSKIKENDFLSIIEIDGIDYQKQMTLIKDKYDDVDIVKHEIDANGFSDSVVADYKKDRASKLVAQFLDSLTDEKRDEVLKENEKLRGYLNVGENI